MLRRDGKFEIIKEYRLASTGKKTKADAISAYAYHPTAADVDDLLNLPIAQLRRRAEQCHIDLTDERINATISNNIRKALWASKDDLALQEKDIPLLKEAGKDIWEQVRGHLPIYALFKSDRKSTDQDGEAQDPLKMAIKEATESQKEMLEVITKKVTQELEAVTQATVDKIAEMNPDLAKELHPKVATKSLESLFSVTLTGEDDIPMDKRGSGTRRLVLLNFFRAKAESNHASNVNGIIYAIEEPETSQHPNNQRMLMDVFTDLVERGGCQILLTTHTPALVRHLNQESLRLLTMENKIPVLHNIVDEEVLRHIKDTLGILPDHDVKVFLGVEGKHDIEFLKRISHILAAAESDIPDLGQAERIGHLVFLPLGGSSLNLWVSRLAGLNRPEFYLTDRDVAPPNPPKYHSEIEKWEERGATAWVTSKRELENYIPVSILRNEVSGYPGTGDPFEDVPHLMAQAIHEQNSSAPWHELSDEKKKNKESRAKWKLNTEFVEKITGDLLNDSDPDNEIRSWLRALGEALNA